MRGRRRVGGGRRTRGILGPRSLSTLRVTAAAAAAAEVDIHDCLYVCIGDGGDGVGGGGVGYPQLLICLYW